VLHHCLDLPVEVVAAQTGVSVGTVKSRLARGREQLAALLATETIPWPTGGARWPPAHGSAAASSWGGPSYGPGPACWSGASGPGRAALPRPAPTRTGWRCGAYDRPADRWTTLAAPSGPVRSSLARASLAWAGREVLAVQNTTQIPPDPPRFGGRYDPAADRWWRLPAPGGWSRVGGGPMVRPIGPGRMAMLVPEPG
jgi:Sigma-70, region 4